MRIKLLLALLIPLYGISQTKISIDINGEAPGDLSGYSVSLSSDGNIVAIGAPYNTGNGIHSGHVRIYENASGTWTQIGDDIDGQAFGNQSGYSVSLSSDGTILAIGAPLYNGVNGTFSGHVRVYKNISGVWTQIGDDIDGEATDDWSGHSISLSADGSIVAIGAPDNDGTGNNAGHVRIYENISGIWTQIGSDIDGEAGGDLSGWSVSLSSNGNIIAIGAPRNDGGGNNAGHVRIYENISGVWTQIGSDIDGEAALDQSGWSVSLSSDGNIVAIGGHRNSGNAKKDSGHVRVYENLSGTWTQVGDDIDGEALGDQSGYSVSLSSDGTVVAVGAPRNSGNGSMSGHVRMYQYLTGEWKYVGQDVDGEAAGDQNGYSVSLSSDGNTVAIGAPHNAGNGNNSGHVRVYDISDIFLEPISSDEFVKINFNIYPNPTSDVLNITLENNLKLERETLYNNLGQVIKVSNEYTLNVDTLSAGIYFVEIETNQGKASKKIIVK